MLEEWVCASDCGGEMVRDAVGGELRSAGEAADGAEAGRSGKTDKIETGDGGFKVCAENGGLVQRLHLAAQILIDKVETLQLHLIASRGDDVIDIEFPRAFALVKDEVDAVFVFAGLFDGGPHVNCDFANDLVLGEPCGSRAIHASNGAEA